MKITEKVTFNCQCGSGELASGGAVKTETNRVYLVFYCEQCGNAVPIEVDKVLSELYTKPLPPGSKMVN